MVREYGPNGIPVTPGGRPERLNWIVPVNPFAGDACTDWNMGAPPCWRAIVGDSSASTKSPAGGGGGGGVVDAPPPPQFDMNVRVANKKTTYTYRLPKGGVSVA